LRRSGLKFGAIGMGTVGRQVLSQEVHGRRDFPIYWVADSKSVLSRESEPFTPKEIGTIVDLKAEGKSLSSQMRGVSNARIDEFRDSRQESRILRSIMTKKEEWLVFNTSSLAPLDDYEIARATMGIAGLCTANKTSWADHRLCSDLYRCAEKSETFLGLNCTTGVWVDQMESLPLVMKYLTKDRITITKRDNSSLNTFFAKVDSSIDPDDAMREIGAAGHLEPGAKDFSKEVHDQILKARIASNICGVLRGIKPRFVDETSAGPDRPRSMSPADIALWHREGDRRRRFKALVSRIVLDQDGKERLGCTVSFGELPRGSRLARHFPGKSAVHIESNGPTASSDRSERRRGSGYFHAGYGGAERTAAKLLWEAERVSRLHPSRGRVPFAPLPVLFAERLGNEAEVKLRETIEASLVLH